MTTPPRRHLICSLAAVLLLLPFLTLGSCGSSASLERREFTEEAPLDQPTSLHIENRNGKVTVTGWDRDKMEVKAVVLGPDESRLADCRLSVTSDGDALRLKVLWPGGKQEDDERSNLRISLPVGGSLTAIENSNGMVRVGDLENDLDIHTSNGRVEVNGHQGTVKVRTSNGEISCRDIQGSFDGETSNDFVKLMGVQKDVRIRTSNGRVEVLCYPTCTGRLDIKSSNASMQVTVGREQVGEFTLKTSNGECRLNLSDRARIVSQNGRTAAVVAVQRRDVKSQIRTSNGNINFFVH